MPTTSVDAIGTWSQLGTVEVSNTDWVQFPEETVQGEELFRITFLPDFDISKTTLFRVWGWLRFVYAPLAENSAGSLLVSPATKLNLKQEQMLLSFPVDPALKANKYLFRIPEVKGDIKSWKGVSLDTIVHTWKLKLECLEVP